MALSEVSSHVNNSRSPLPNGVKLLPEFDALLIPRINTFYTDKNFRRNNSPLFCGGLNTAVDVVEDGQKMSALPPTTNKLKFDPKCKIDKTAPGEIWIN
jgi:hypothetical protein